MGRKGGWGGMKASVEVQLIYIYIYTRTCNVHIYSTYTYIPIRSYMYVYIYIYIFLFSSFLLSSLSSWLIIMIMLSFMIISKAARSP